MITNLYPTTVKRILRKLGQDVYGFDKFWVDDNQLYGLVIDDHPWKEREFRPHILRKLTAEETSLLVTLCDKDKQADEVQREADAANRDAVKAWQASVAGRDLGDRISIAHGFVVDQYGNLLFRLPNRILTDEELASLASNIDWDSIE